MRVVLVIIIVLLVLALFGWLRFSSPGGNPTLEIDTGRIEQDAEKVIESSQDAAHDAAQELEETMQREPANL